MKKDQKVDNPIEGKIIVSTEEINNETRIQATPESLFRPKMYQPRAPHKTNVETEPLNEGEPIERRIEKIMNNGEPITDGAPIIHTLRKDGVIPEYDVRTDRFELAIEATDSISRQALAKRQEFHDNLDRQNQQKPPTTEPNPGTGANTSDNN